MVSVSIITSPFASPLAFDKIEQPQPHTTCIVLEAIYDYPVSFLNSAAVYIYT